MITQQQNESSPFLSLNFLSELSEEISPETRQKSKTKNVPKLTQHKASGQAVVRINGRDHYCGKWKTSVARSKYKCLINQWLAGRPTDGTVVETIAELAAAFWPHVLRYYRDADGNHTSEVGCYRPAMQYLKPYAETDVEDFGPRMLKEVRANMIADNLARRTINKYIIKIKRIFAWAGEEELIDAVIAERLRVVKGLQKNRGGRELPRRRPVEWEKVLTIRGRVSEMIWDMVQLQWHTGMRSGSLVIMRPCDIDRNGPVWVYRPETHKMDYDDEDGEREFFIAIGPQGQMMLSRWMIGCRDDEYIFSPAKSEALRKAAIIAERKARGGVGNHKRAAKNPERQPGERYTSDTYRRAVSRGVTAATRAEWLKTHAVRPRDEAERKEYAALKKRLHWHPHLLRHSFATRASREFQGEFGLEVTRAALGHKHITTTEIYAEMDRKQAIEVARRIG